MGKAHSKLPGGSRKRRMESSKSMPCIDSSDTRAVSGVPVQMITQVDKHQQQSEAASINALPANLSPISASDYEALLPVDGADGPSRLCLVLDLDETLVHSSLKTSDAAAADYVIPVDIAGNHHDIYVRLRPHLEQFMERVSELFEVVVFTASLAEYADPLLDMLDPDHTFIQHRLFREHCSCANGLFVKDLSLLGRPLDKVAIIDNSATSFLFQPRNGIQCVSWFDDESDSELEDLLPVLEQLATAESTYPILDKLRLHRQSGKDYQNFSAKSPELPPAEPFLAPLSEELSFL